MVFICLWFFFVFYSNGGEVKGVCKVMEQDKRLRREIANSNERRRMQSINAGFNSLKTLLPHHDGEKLSKVIIIIEIYLL